MMPRKNDGRFGEVREWSKAVFVWADGLPGELVVYQDAKEYDFLRFLSEYPTGKHCGGIGFEQDSGTFWAVWNQDCYDPPVVVVKDTQEYAIESFVTGTKYAERFTDDEAEEREREGLPVAVAENDVHYNPETIEVRAVKLKKVEFRV